MKNYALLLIILSSLNFSLPVSGQTEDISGHRIPPELIPPEVTLSNNNNAVPSQTQSGSPNPGTTSPGGYVNPNASGITKPAPQVPNSDNAPAPASVDKRPDPIAIIETDKGIIAIRLFRKYAPKTTANFIELVDKGFYNDLTFHRVEPGFCIQGGDPRGDGFGVYTDPVTNQPRMLQLETSPRLKHNAPGVVAMAHFPKDPNTSSCQFYITLSAQPQLDGDYSIFGGVLQGMDVVRKITKGDKMKRVVVQEQLH